MDGAIAPKRARILGGGGTVAAIKFTRILTYLGRERNLPSRKGTTGTWLASVNCSERDQMMGQRQEKFMT
jgi:hypothetical protein